MPVSQWLREENLDVPGGFDVDPMTTVVILDNAPTPVEGLQHEDDFIHVLPDAGTVLATRWELVALRSLGSGSAVFRGRHRWLDWPVAVKFVHTHRYMDRAIMVANLGAEARILRHLDTFQHPNIIRLCDFEEHPESPWMVTEFVEGLTLAELIRKIHRLPISMAVRVAAQMADAMTLLQSMGIVHRDVKPENILLKPNGSAILVDFGFAIVRGSEMPPIQVSLPSSVCVGTPAYMAPEQSRSTGTIDFRADMYALGVTLYQMVTGQLPFVGNNAVRILIQHREEMPKPPIEIVRSVGTTLSNLILRMMSKRPEDRFGSFADLSRILRRIAVKSP